MPPGAICQFAIKLRVLPMYHLDGWGFDGAPFMQWVMDCCYWVVQVVLRPEQTKGFVLLKKRWVVERTFGWLRDVGD